MSEETAVLISIGKRVYRKYPILLKEPADTKYEEGKIRMLEEDDGEGEEEFVNLDVKDYEDFVQNPSKKYAKEDTKAENSIVETIVYDPQMSSYKLFNKLGNRQHFANIIGACSLDRTEFQKTVEVETQTVIKGNIKDSTLEIRGSSPDFVMNANEMILNFLNKTFGSRPSDYNVINQKSRKLIIVLKPSDKISKNPIDEEKEDEESKDEPIIGSVSFNEYPELQIA